METGLLPDGIEESSDWEIIDKDEAKDSSHGGFEFNLITVAMGCSRYEFLEIKSVDVISSSSARDSGDQDQYVDDDEEDYDDDLDLTDELVPWNVDGRFGKCRIKKLGKRPYPKMTSSHKGVRTYHRSGSVYGKHSFGMKHIV